MIKVMEIYNESNENLLTNLVEGFMIYNILK